MRKSTGDAGLALVEEPAAGTSMGANIGAGVGVGIIVGIRISIIAQFERGGRETGTV